MGRLLVIGYGNPLRGDDGLGMVVALHLQQTIVNNAVEILAEHQIFPEMAALIWQAEKVIFIDACVEGIPGEWRRQRVLPATDMPLGALIHQFELSQFLAFTQKLYGTCPPVDLITVTGKSFAFEERLSTEVQAALPAVIDAVKDVILSAL